MKTGDARPYIALEFVMFPIRSPRSLPLVSFTTRSIALLITLSFVIACGGAGSVDPDGPNPDGSDPIDEAAGRDDEFY